MGGAVVVSGPCKDKSGSIAVLSDPMDAAFRVLGFPPPRNSAVVCGIPKSLPMRPRWPANGPYDAISEKEAAWTPGNRLTRL